MIISSTKTIGLIGNVFDPIQGETLKTLVIANGKIARVMDGRQPLTDFPGIAIISLDEGTTIFPGLINLHTHTTYNILPIWENGQIWTNRFQWRNNSGYQQDINSLLNYIKSNWKNDPDPNFVRSILAKVKGAATTQAALSQVNTAYAIISEIQAVAGGTTLIQETLDLDSETPDDRSFIIRNTGDQSDLDIPAGRDVYSVIDFYEPNVKPDGTPGQDTSTWTPVVQTPYHDFVQSVNNDNSSYYSCLVHAGEGKSGFVKGSTRDPYSTAEMDLLIQSLQQDITLAQNLANAHFSLTHGCGIDLTNDQLLDFISTNHISLIWSPVSNLLLYRDTTDVSKLLARGINVCLGSDWSPSGSKHVLDELKFAHFVNGLLGLNISTPDLYSMVTTNPVKALGISGTGSIQANYDADLFVLRKQNPADDALTALLACNDSDIDFVMVNGRIVFGLTAYFNQLAVDFQSFPATEGAAIAQRGVSINADIAFNLVDSLDIIDTLMQQYCSTVIHQPQMKRTRLMASDDTIYQNNINTLQQQLTGLYPS